MQILVDVDGVCCDTYSSWLALYNEEYGDSLTVEQITEWEVHRFVKPICGTRIYDYLPLGILYDRASPVGEALDAVAELRESGHHVVFVSAGIYPHKVEWLHRHGFLAEYPHGKSRWQHATDVVIAGDKGLVRGDILVDDRFENCLDFASWGGFAVLFDQPWNRGRVLSRSIERAFSWSDALDIIEEERRETYWHDARLA